MNFKRFLLFLVAPLAMVMSSCEPDTPVYTTPAITIADANGAAVTALNFNAEGGEQSFTITATRGWNISKTGDWFAISPSSATNESMEEKTTEVKITVAPNDGEARTETIKVVMEKTEKNIVVSQAGEGQTALGAEIFGDNFDKTIAAKSGNDWPALDGFENPTGAAAEGVTYTVANVQARSNSPSNNSHSGYKDEASGNNNAFFRTNGVLTINNINLSAQTSKDYTLTFGCYRSIYDDTDNSFKSSEFHVLLSADGEKWTEVAYTRPADEVSNYGTWNKATATFSLKEKPATLSVRFVSDLASTHRLDDVKFFVGGGGEEIDLANGTTSGGNTEVDPNAQTITVAQFIENADTNTTYQLTGTIVGPVNTTYGNFDLEDESGKIYVYGLIDGSTGKNLDWAAKGLSEGDIITVQGKYYLYEKNGTTKHEIVDALYISHTANSTPRITSISPEEMSFSAEGGSKVATVNTAGNGGTLAATTAAEWLTVNAADGVVTIVAAANEGEAREAEVTVTYGESTATVTVKQAAPIVAGSVVTATITFDDKAKRSVYTNDQQVWEENGITVTNDKAASTSNIGDYTNPARFYKSSNVTVSVAGTISKLVFHINTYDNGKYITAMTDSVEGETVVDNVVTITLDGTSSSYSFTTANQVRVDSIDVTYTAGEQGGEPTDPENPEGGEPTDPENPEGGETPEEPETPVVPETLATLDTEAYYVFKQATEFVPGKWYAIVAENKAATALTGNYGYLNVVTPIALTDGISLPASCAWGVVSTEGGYTIQQYDGKYVYQSGSYDSFNVAATAPASGQVWTIENGVITNATTAKTVQYDTNYNSYGCYATVKGVYPTFYELVEVDTNAHLLGTSVSSLSYTADGGENTFDVTTYGEATLAATTDAEWLTVSVADGVVTVVAAANEGEARTAEVTVTFGEDSKTITIAQGAPVADGAEVTDIINNAFTGVGAVTNYTEWSGKTGESGAVYAGQSAGDGGTVQMRSSKSNSGVVTTTSGGKVSKVVIKWNTTKTTNTNRTVDIYVSHTAFSQATDMYNSKKADATKIASATLANATNGVSEITLDGTYEFVGFRSNDGALYLDSIEVTWIK